MWSEPSESAMTIEQARSMLFVPGDRAERFAKARGSGADAIIIDLEDAVLPTSKASARIAIAEHFGEGAASNVLVRVNAAGTEWHDDDLALCRRTGIAGIVLPKAEDSARTEAAGRVSGKAVVPIVESALGLANLDEIARSQSVVRLILGTIDLALDLDIRHGSEGGSRILDAARYHMVVASRAAGRASPVDGVHTSIKDNEGLSRTATFARDSGFGGMLCIHPLQCATVNAAFRPTDAERAWAAKVVGAAERNPGAFQLDGQMIDAPVVARARRIQQQPAT